MIESRPFLATLDGRVLDEFASMNSRFVKGHTEGPLPREPLDEVYVFQDSRLRIVSGILSITRVKVLGELGEGPAEFLGLAPDVGKGCRTSVVGAHNFFQDQMILLHVEPILWGFDWFPATQTTVLHSS